MSSMNIRCHKYDAIPFWRNIFHQARLIMLPARREGERQMGIYRQDSSRSIHRARHHKAFENETFAGARNRLHHKRYLNYRAMPLYVHQKKCTPGAVRCGEKALKASFFIPLPRRFHHALGPNLFLPPLMQHTSIRVATSSWRGKYSSLP